MSTPGNQDPLTRKEFDSLNAYQKGYTAYFQAQWNTEVPEKCPFKKGTKDYFQYLAGSRAAAMEAQEGDD